ncbi:MAG: 4-deoxy-4-formamido-L-arabinose-phosphoundecaprenol deformylase [Syntrophobacterales bacterium]|nr:4-deoxy-4-formamido-L-arabinose-phosphoundecaprenol deformylase [Syntrophobacterales bacterium]
MGGLGLKIDVDTLAGLVQGVPALLRLLGARGVRASFFVALGPDNSGRAIFRVFRQRGFLAKMLRTRAPSLYGWRTLLSGTLLPAPHIGAHAGELLPRMAAAGHEVGLHGYDHVLWHDRLLTMSKKDIRRQVEGAQAVFAGVLGQPAHAFAAPGWQASRASREVLAEMGFLYASDTRGTGPYLPRFGDWVSPVLELPTTLPTLDELLGFQGLSAREAFRLVEQRVLRRTLPQVFTLHAELEGGPLQEEFARFLDRLGEQGVEFFRLGDWAAKLRPREVPPAAVVRGRLPGRAGWVSCQAQEERA